MIVIRDATKEKWKIISKNERSITVNGRHYFAARCNPSVMWVIDEVDQAEPHGSKLVQRIAERLTTRDVTRYFK